MTGKFLNLSFIK